MYSKALIKSAIKIKKDEYFDYDVSYSLVEAAIYKGLYQAMGGSKAISLPIRFQDLTIISELFFKFYIKISNIDDISEINSIFKKVASKYYCGELSNNTLSTKSNSELANMFNNLVFSKYTEDIVINKENIYKTIFELLESDFSIFKYKEL